MSSCRQVSAMLDAHRDGELGPDQSVTVEAHLLDCSICAERARLEHALRTSLRRVVYDIAQPSPAFRDRIAQSLSAERERLAGTAAHATSRGGMLSWNAIVPLAAAAAIALFWTASTNENRRTGRNAPSVAAATDSMNIEQLLDEIVDRHIEPVAADVTEPTQLARFEPMVGVPVNFPSLAQYGASWEGGRVVPLRNQRAASLRFQVGGHKMTLYVYNSERFPLKAKLEPRVVRNEPIYVGWKRGYSIAAKDHRGVGYAVTTDLSDQESAEIVASLH